MSTPILSSSFRISSSVNRFGAGVVSCAGLMGVYGGSSGLFLPKWSYLSALMSLELLMVVPSVVMLYWQPR